MSAADDRLCGKCRFWVRNLDDPDVGVCRRMPRNENGKKRLIDWCGKWKRIKLGAAHSAGTG